MSTRSDHQKRLGVVGSSSDNSVAGHWNVLDNDLSVGLAGDPDPGRAGANTGRDLEEVVSLSCSDLPGVARVGRHLHLGGAFVCVHHLRTEPVCGNAALHVDLNVASDIWAADVVPGDVDDTGGWRGESGEGVGEEIEMVCAAAWALVDDLAVTLG